MANPLRIPSAEDFPHGWRWLGRTAIWFITTRNRWRTSRAERKRVVVLDATIQTLREQQSKCPERGLSHMERVHNVSLYFLLVDRDLSFWKLEMVSTFDLQRLRFAARQVALLLYEACDDLSELLGKQFRQSLPALGISETEIREFNAVSKRLSSFKASNEKLLYNDIRNVAAGTQSARFTGIPAQGRSNRSSPSVRTWRRILRYHPPPIRFPRQNH